MQIGRFEFNMERFEQQNADIPIANIEDVKEYITRLHVTGEEHRGRVPVPERIQCLVAQVALQNSMRFDWNVMKPVYHGLIDSCIEEYREEEEEEVKEEEEDETTEKLGAGLNGTVEETEIIISKDVPGSRAYVDAKKKELHGLLDRYARGAPCMIQRLSELLLFPKKQYQDVSKLLRSLLILLSVMKTYDGGRDEPLARSMTREELGRVNENPPSPYL